MEMETVFIILFVVGATIGTIYIAHKLLGSKIKDGTSTIWQFLFGNGEEDDKKKKKGPEHDKWLAGGWIAYWIILCTWAHYQMPNLTSSLVENVGIWVILGAIALFVAGNYFYGYEKDAVKKGRGRFWKIAMATGVGLIILTPIIARTEIDKTEDPLGAIGRTAQSLALAKAEATQPREPKTFEILAQPGRWGDSAQQVFGERALVSALGAMSSSSYFTITTLERGREGEVKLKTSTGREINLQGMGQAPFNWKELGKLQAQSTKGKVVPVVITIHY